LHRSSGKLSGERPAASGTDGQTDIGEGAGAGDGDGEAVGEGAGTGDGAGAGVGEGAGAGEGDGEGTIASPQSLHGFARQT